MESNENEKNKMAQQLYNAGFFQFQSNGFCMSQQQQSSSIFPNLMPFPNNVNIHGPRPNQVQHASYPEGAVYYHASGPGWQQQQLFYPGPSFK